MSSFVMSRRAALVGIGAFASAGLSGLQHDADPRRSIDALGFPDRLHRGQHSAVARAERRSDRELGPAGAARPARPGLGGAYGAGRSRGDTQRARRLHLSRVGRVRQPRHDQGRRDAERRRGPAREISVHAIAIYFPGTVAQGLPEQVYQGRVTALSQAFAYRLKRKLGL